VSVTFQNDHDTLSVGMGKPGAVFQGTGTDQYIVKSIEAELKPLSAIRQMLVDRIWRGNDPFRGFSNNLFEYDTQGWGSQHHYLSDTIARLRPSVIVEIGVWKGGSTIFMAEAAKALALDTVVIAVDTWLGSSEHWLTDGHFRQMSFLNGYPALYHKFLSNVIRAGVSNRVLPIPLASVGASEVLKALNVAAGIIHIDAAHDYDSVMADLRAWWPVLEPGGVLIGDDYAPTGGWASVREAFDDFFRALALPIESAGGKCRVQMPR
jgi:predicted O-methyltransferase YrrM